MKTNSGLPIHRLECGDLRLDVCPQLGGSVVRWSILRRDERVDLLRPAPADLHYSPDPDSVLNTGCFPLVPYSGRIANAGFNFHDQHIRQPTLSQFHPHAIHGHGWLSAWQVVSESATKLVIEHRNDADVHSNGNHWPWLYVTQQTFTLADRLLTIDLQINNESKSTMPAGLGLHPYFPLHEGAIIKSSSTGFWSTDDYVLPTEHQQMGPEHPYNQAFSPTEHALDTVFTGWNGRARLEWPRGQFALDIQADADHLIIFTPPGEDYFCVEPATHAANSFNHEISDQQVIDPGGQLRLSTHLKVNI